MELLGEDSDERPRYVGGIQSENSLTSATSSLHPCIKHTEDNTCGTTWIDVLIQECGLVYIRSSSERTPQESRMSDCSSSQATAVKTVPIPSKLGDTFNKTTSLFPEERAANLTGYAATEHGYCRQIVSCSTKSCEARAADKGDVNVQLNTHCVRQMSPVIKTSTSRASGDPNKHDDDQPDVKADVCWNSSNIADESPNGNAVGLTTENNFFDDFKSFENQTTPSTGQQSVLPDEVSKFRKPIVTKRQRAVNEIITEVKTKANCSSNGKLKENGKKKARGRGKHGRYPEPCKSQVESKSEGTGNDDREDKTAQKCVTGHTTSDNRIHISIKRWKFHMQTFPEPGFEESGSAQKPDILASHEAQKTNPVGVTRPVTWQDLKDIYLHNPQPHVYNDEHHKLISVRRPTYIHIRNNRSRALEPTVSHHDVHTQNSILTSESGEVLGSRAVTQASAENHVPQTNQSGVVKDLKVSPVLPLKCWNRRFIVPPFMGMPPEIAMNNTQYISPYSFTSHPE